MIQDNESRENNNADLLLMVKLDKMSRKKNCADLFLQVRRDLNSIDEWHRHVAKVKMRLDEYKEELCIPVSTSKMRPD